MAKLLLIEDDEIMGESLVDRFSLENFFVRWARTIAEASDWLERERFAIVVSDVRLPDGTGEQLYAQQREQPGQKPPWLFITAFATVERAVAMLRAGACDYITKPFDIAELVAKVKTLLPSTVGGEEASLNDRGDAVLGVSPAMRHLQSLAQRVATRMRTVLITGESGVGKEVLARYLHQLADPSPTLPFVAVNCGAIPESLMEASLFGHERGAFTGADRARRGYVEQASGGTLFLDEIAELSPAMQVRLLRVLQDRKVQRIGAEKTIELELRVMCATHRDLRERVRTGDFREDLFYRINVVHLRVPPLRERSEDIAWLSERFLREQAADRREVQRTLSVGARARLLAYAWPGNVRELRNRIESAVVMALSPELHAADLFDDATPESTWARLPTLGAFVGDAEREYLKAVLERCEGRVAHAAQILGVSRKTVWEKTRRYGLRAVEEDVSRS